AARPRPGLRHAHPARRAPGGAGRGAQPAPRAARRVAAARRPVPGDGRPAAQPGDRPNDLSRAPASLTPTQPPPSPVAKPPPPSLAGKPEPSARPPPLVGKPEPSAVPPLPQWGSLSPACAPPSLVGKGVGGLGHSGTRPISASTSSSRSVPHSASRAASDTG